MKKPHGCFFPLNALAIHPHGDQKYCLISKASASADQAAFADESRKTHDSLLNGQWPASCSSCQRKEQNGILSRRVKFWERKIASYGETVATDLIQNQTKPSIRHLEISFSNVCNLQCAMCSSEFSSSWVRDDIAAIQQGLEFRKYTEPYARVARLPAERIEQILSHANEFDQLIVKGGEPTRDPQCLDFLNKLGKVRGGNLPNIFIQSNGTRDPREWLPALGDLQFDFGLSIDGWGDVYEWIRGTSFSKVIDYFKYLADQPRIKSLSMDFTLSAFNVLHLPLFLEKILELKSQYPKFTICPFFQWAQDNFNSVEAVDVQTRRQIAKQCQPLMEAHPDFFLNYDNLLEILNSDVRRDINCTNTVRWIDYVNGLRGRSLYDIEPRLQTALKVTTP